MIKFKLLPDGAFVAGDTDTGRTCYSYPTSPHAVKAKKAPGVVAVKMMAQENSYGDWRDKTARDCKYDARNWDRLNA